MQIITAELILKIKELISNGKADRFFGWKHGDLPYDAEPSIFENGSTDGFVYNDFCSPNLCKYMIEESKKEKKILVLMKPCDSVGLELLTEEHRVMRENIYALGVPCSGKIDMDKARDIGIKGILSVNTDGNKVVFETLYGEKTIDRSEVLSGKCLRCSGKEHIGCDEVFMSELSEETTEITDFDDVKKIENMTENERFDFWRSQLSKCIRCNACRNVCPACSCLKCVFDNDDSGIASKSNADDFEENMFHIIRSFHVCGRCVDCGECSRVCPQKIPLHLLNRKYIKELNDCYGENENASLLTFKKDDPETTVIYERGAENV